MSHARIEAMLEESGFDHDEMAAVVDVLAPLEELADHAPAASADLAALFGPLRDNTVALVAVPRSRARSAAVGAVVIALSSVGATGLSAAANTLPRPIQHQVAQFSQDHLPFDLPEPPPPGEPFGAELPQAPLVPDTSQTAPIPVPLGEQDFGGNGHRADRPGSFPAATPSAGPTAASASSRPSFMPSPSPASSSSSSGSSSGSPSPGGRDDAEPSSKAPSPNQGDEDDKPKRPPKDKHQGFGPDDGKGHKPGKGKDNGKDDGEGQGNGPLSPSPGGSDGGGQGDGQGSGQGDGGDDGGAPELPPPLVLPDPPPPSPSVDVLPGADPPVDGTLTGGQ